LRLYLECRGELDREDSLLWRLCRRLELLRLWLAARLLCARCSRRGDDDRAPIRCSSGFCGLAGLLCANALCEKAVCAGERWASGPVPK
jgi:hypothetical protein